MHPPPAYLLTSTYTVLPPIPPSPSLPFESNLTHHATMCSCSYLITLFLTLSLANLICIIYTHKITFLIFTLTALLLLIPGTQFLSSALKKDLVGAIESHFAQTGRPRIAGAIRSPDKILSSAEYKDQEKYWILAWERRQREGAIRGISERNLPH